MRYAALLCVQAFVVIIMDASEPSGSGTYMVFEEEVEEEVFNGFVEAAERLVSIFVSVRLIISQFCVEFTG